MTTLIEKYKDAMQEVLNNAGDREADHAQADTLLTDLLIELGYKEVVEIYDKIEKWYA